MAPREWRTVFKRVFLVAPRLLKRLRMLVKQARPFDLLLVEAKRAATTRAPAIIIGQANTCRLEKLGDGRFVYASGSEGQMDLQIIRRRDITFTIVLVGPDRDVTVDPLPCLERRPKPFLEGFDLELPRAPASLRGRQEILVFRK